MEQLDTALGYTALVIGFLVISLLIWAPFLLYDMLKGK
jgi:hypothetical protein